ncbi:tRNA1(Val) (adenine(37)-N6)-methyltransferase [Shewanella waksmanii]|uniref:tRNA1(Val) (adenine(37)-N6)-methyltransferase n=1 Tax=Shewanella waksmanii TaxID=213783 RepID=UPI00048FE435|nr:methyltransferase [Shewanella waksmanii]
MAFTFQQFHIDDHGCGMPVSTDGVILGAWAKLVNAKHILDIGAGSGLLSLMAAQRSQGQITAVEIDSVAAKACQSNFSQSPWQNRLKVHHGCISTLPYSLLFDHIICNPPYFNHGPRAQCDKRAQARHTQTLSFNDLCQHIEQRLQPTGNASVIIPSQSLIDFEQAAKQRQLHIRLRTDVASTLNKPAARHLLMLSKSFCNTVPDSTPETLVIRDNNNQYTAAMVALTKAFYLNL